MSKGNRERGKPRNGLLAIESKHSYQKRGGSGMGEIDKGVKSTVILMSAE